MTRTASAVAHPNIALAKYWGKAVGAGNAPAVPSLSVTLEGMETRTSVAFRDELAHDVFVLDGVTASPEETVRVSGLLDAVRRAAGFSAFAEVVSRNDFPTASGLASSASGFAALALAATAAAGLPPDLAVASDLARRASASSARSLFAGFVELAAGDGTDGFLAASQVAPPEALDLTVCVAVTTEARKEVASRSGMNHTARTSPFYAAWVAHAPSLFAEARRAILAGDLLALGAAAEESALCMHASAIAARPGIVYWNGASVEALAKVRELRAAGLPAFATMDAGPHVKVLCHRSLEGDVSAALGRVPGVVRVLLAHPGSGARLLASS